MEATLPSGDFGKNLLFISNKNPEKFLVSPTRLHSLQLTVATSPLKISYPEKRFHLPTIVRGNVGGRVVTCLYSPKPEKTT